MTVQDLAFGKKDKRDTYKPLSNNNERPSKEDITNSLFKVCKKYGSVFTHTVDPPSDDSDNDDHNYNYLSLQDIIQHYRTGHDTIEKQEFVQHLCTIHTPEMTHNIEKQTKEQTDCDMWFVFRKGRLTASIMGSILNCNLERLSSDNYIVKTIQGGNRFFSTKATDYGKQWKMLREISTVKFTVNHTLNQKL